MTLWLVGLMGTGKSSAGRSAASSLGIPFADTDEMVEASAGRSISEIWETEGEQVFRSLESEAVAAAAVIGGIVSTGGGVVVDERNRRHLKEGRAVVWLEAPVTVIEERLRGEAQRPGLMAAGEGSLEFLSGLLEEREHIYRDLATHRISTVHLAAEEVAARIVQIWND